MKELLAISSALSDEGRVRILAALHGGELCVCQMIELLGLAPSTTSKHLSILKAAGLVDTRKKGRWVYYRSPDTDVSPCVTHALAWVKNALEKQPRIKEDAARLKQILKEDPEALCRRQAGSSCCPPTSAVPTRAEDRQPGIAGRKRVVRAR